MNQLPYPFGLTILLMLSLNSALCGQSPSHPDKTSKVHTILIKAWNLPLQKNDPAFEVEFDGKLLGKPDSRDELALSALDSIKFEDGCTVKVTFPALRIPPMVNFLCRARFLHHAIADGASLEFYCGDKAVDFHTLSFQNLRPGPSAPEKGLRGGFNMDTATYELDGKRFADGHKVAVELRKLPFKDKVLLVLFPPDFGSGDYDEINTDTSEIDDCVSKLEDDGVKLVGVGNPRVWPVTRLAK